MRNIELLAPGGDVDSIKAAIAAGADAVYCGLDKFNARNRAANISFEDLNGILRLAHQNNCQVFLTLNIIIVESEIPSLVTVLNRLVNTSIDGIIVQDLGMLSLLTNYFKTLKIHASTQLTTHNAGQLQFLNKLNATRVNLSRELSIDEIKALTPVAHENNLLVEVFVHGSNCICFSGICYLSSVHGGNSGNRGRCSQPCRDQYLTTPEGKNFPLNLKDNSAWSDLKELADAGADSIKIEGRIKKFPYVYTVVNAWRKQLQNFQNGNQLINGKHALYKAFNRDFSNVFLKGVITADQFIDNPRDHSAIYLAEINGGITEETIEQAKGDIFDERAEIATKVGSIIHQLSTAKAPLTISLSGKCGTPLKVAVTTPDASFVVLSETNLVRVATQSLNCDLVLSRLKALNDTEYTIEQLDLDNLQPDVFIPFKELTAIKKRLLFILNGSREFIEPITLPVLKKQTGESLRPTLSVIISSQDDLHLCNETTAVIYYQIPDCFKNVCAEYIDLFNQNQSLIPWFPSVLIGDDYNAALEFLQRIQPKLIVTNNTGIAYEAYQNGIAWIAGPYLNSVNSYSLACLKENFNCSGAFISNELSKTQIQRIKKPGNFELYYSIYHPIVLMTSRQCLFHQVTGCEKDTIDDDCIQHCNKTAEVTNLKKETFVIEKSSNNYHRIYNEVNFLNTDIVTDLPDFFSGFSIDLTDILTETKKSIDKSGVIQLFENLLKESPDAIKEIHSAIHPSTNDQYRNGI
jgi:U32 family peptidase